MTDDWRYDGTNIDNGSRSDEKGSDGCKDCCSIVCGAFSLAGLVAVLAPILLGRLYRKLPLDTK